MGSTSFGKKSHFWFKWIQKIQHHLYRNLDYFKCKYLGKKAMTKLESILKNRDIALPTKVCIVKAMVFPVVMYRCESWTIKKASTKELMLLNCGAGEDSRVPWIARRSNQSILKEINTEYSLEGLMLKLKLQSFGHLIWRADSLERPWWWERLKAGGEGGDRGWDG